MRDCMQKTIFSTAKRQQKNNLITSLQTIITRVISQNENLFNSVSSSMRIGA